jgi:hypothetical protein
MRETTSLCGATKAALRIESKTDLVVDDVREAAEHAELAIPRAVKFPCGFPEFQIAQT